LRSVLDIDPVTVAEQLTLIESDYWLKIKPSDFFQKSWKLDKRGGSNLITALNWGEKLTEWVRKSSINNRDLAQAYILMAQECYRRRNWQTSFSIMVGLSKSISIQIIEKLPINTKKAYEKLYEDLAFNKILDEQYRIMRRELDYRNSNAEPAIPALRILIHRFDTLESEYSIHPENNVLINYKKCDECCILVSQFLYYQDLIYSFVSKESIGAFLISSVNGKV